LVQPLYPGRSKAIAIVLAIFGGWFGAHKFYLGKTRTGIFYLLFFWSSIPLLLAIVDALILAFKPKYDFEVSNAGQGHVPASMPEVSSDTPMARQSIETHSNTKRVWYKSPFAWVGIALVVLIIPNLLPDRDAIQTSSQTSSVRPEPSSSPKPSSNPASQSSEDKACSAMKNADMAVALVGRKITQGTATRADADSLGPVLASVNSAYKSLDGDFYWYLVAQGNSIDLLQRSIANEDWYSAGVALGAYLDADEFTRFCY
jgi:TM2 domain-containing membrane protein YozV